MHFVHRQQWASRGFQNEGMTGSMKILAENNIMPNPRSFEFTSGKQYWRRGAAAAGGCKATSLTADPMLSPPIPSPSREVPDPSAAPPCSRRCQVCSPHPPPPSPCHLIPQPASKHNPSMSFRGGDTCAGNRPGQSSPSCPAILQALHPIRPPSLELPPRSIWEQGSRSLQPFEGRLCESSLRMLGLKEKMLLSEFLYSGSQNADLCDLICVIVREW